MKTCRWCENVLPRIRDYEHFCSLACIDAWQDRNDAGGYWTTGAEELWIDESRVITVMSHSLFIQLDDEYVCKKKRNK